MGQVRAETISTKQLYSHGTIKYPSALLADSGFDESLNSADLIANGAGQDWYDSRNFDSTIITLDTLNIAGNPTNKAAIQNYGISSVAYLTQELSQPQTDIFSISLDIYIDRIEDSGSYDRSGMIYLGDDSISTNAPTGTSNERFVFMAFYDSSPGDSGDDLQLRARTSSGQSWSNTAEWTQLASGLSYDRWYTVRVEPDVSGGSYDVYVDDVLVGDDVSKYSGYSSGSLIYVSFVGDGNGRGDFYVDNVLSPTEGLFSLTVNTVGSGSVTKSPNQASYEDGTSVTLTAVANSGWTFSGWNGDLSGTNNPASIDMSSDKSVTATFTQPSDSLKLLRFESSHTLGANANNGAYVSTITDMYFCWPWDAAVIDEMHAAGGEVIVYRNYEAMYDGTSELQMAIQNGWVLEDINGNYVYERGWPMNKVIDSGNQDYQQFLVDWMTPLLEDGFDGVFADNAGSIFPQTQWLLSAHPVNPRTGQLYTDNDWMEDHIDIINHFKNQLPDAIFVANGMLFNGLAFDWDRQEYAYFLENAEIDILFIEGIFNNMGTLYSETDWKRSVDLIIWIQNNFLDDPSKDVVLWAQAKSGIPPDVTRDQMARFIFTSSLMGVSRSEQNYISPHGHMESTTTQDLYRIDLGMPAEDYHIIQGTHVYERDYSKVKVLVNPTNAEYIVVLDGEYTDLDGNTISSISIPAYTGTILTPVE